MSLRHFVTPLAQGLTSPSWHRLAIMPLVAFLPAPLAYELACWRGDWCYYRRPHEREQILCNLEAILGEQLSPAERDRVARDFLRRRACEAIDTLRLAGKGRALRRLVEIRGREHLEAALAAGKGAILCSAHLGFYDGCFSLLGAEGFPITVIGRWGSTRQQQLLLFDRMTWEIVYKRLTAHHRYRPNIEPEPGQLATAVQAAAILRANEVVTICIDAPPLAADRPRAVPMAFLGRQARLLPGGVILAQLTGAPLLMTFMRRAADWRHQVLEISPPVLLDGDVMTAFGRCLALVEAAIRQDPAHWIYWGRPHDLIALGLLPSPDAGGAATPAGVAVHRKRKVRSAAASAGRTPP
jgi:lauroyl/myristoyl acyltransferase